MKYSIYIVVTLLMIIGCSQSKNLINTDNSFAKENYLANKTGAVLPVDYKFVNKKVLKF